MPFSTYRPQKLTQDGEVLSLRWGSYVSVSKRFGSVSCVYVTGFWANLMFTYVVPMETLIYGKFKMKSCEALNKSENVRRPTTYKLLRFTSVVSRFAFGRRYEECLISLIYS